MKEQTQAVCVCGLDIRKMTIHGSGTASTREWAHCAELGEVMKRHGTRWEARPAGDQVQAEATA